MRRRLWRAAESRPDLLRVLLDLEARNDPAVFERAMRRLDRFLTAALEDIRDDVLAEDAERRRREGQREINGVR